MAFVDIISIWLFGTTDSVNTSDFLTDLHRAKNAGFKGRSAEVCYTHSMTTRYPSVFVGKDKSPILSMTTIKMLESSKPGGEMALATATRSVSQTCYRLQFGTINNTARIIFWMAT